MTTLHLEGVLLNKCQRDKNYLERQLKTLNNRLDASRRKALTLIERGNAPDYHTGYLDAVEDIREEVRRALEEYEG